MKFIKNNSNPSSGNALTLVRENSAYEVMRLSDDSVAFCDRRPRKDSKYWNDAKYLIWDLERNEKA